MTTYNCETKRLKKPGALQEIKLPLLGTSQLQMGDGEGQGMADPVEVLSMIAAWLLLHPGKKLDSDPGRSSL